MIQTKTFRINPKGKVIWVLLRANNKSKHSKYCVGDYYWCRSGVDFTEDYFHLKKNQSTRSPKLFFSPTRICCARVLVSLVCGCQQTQRRWDKGSYLFSPSSAVWWCLKTFSWGLLWPFCTLIKKEPRTREHCMSKKPSTHVCVCGGGCWHTFSMVFVELVSHFLPLLHL